MGLVYTTGCAGGSDIKPPAMPTEAREMPAYSTSLAAPNMQPTRERSSPGSLWSSNSNSLLTDNKARAVGDIVTITVSEESKAENEANTKTGRTHDLSTDMTLSDPTIGGKGLLGGPSTLGYKGNFENSFNGTGSTDRSNSITSVMTATVVDILPNGNLMIRGSRWTKVNDEYQQTVLEGVIRPSDITRNNTILSQNIADARIFIVGKGPVTQMQKPGWLGQLLNVISPF
jgi:flagellar L-ring protein precursor FlgH